MNNEKEYESGLIFPKREPLRWPPKRQTWQVWQHRRRNFQAKGLGNVPHS